jgi:hypothetical protein
VTFRSYPSRLGKPDGRGYVVCDRSGFLRKPSETIEEDTGARVAREFADLTPGFGTRHPQDVNQAEIGGDPTPIENARPGGPPLTKRDLNISDAEILAAIREDRPPRRGF